MLFYIQQHGTMMPVTKKEFTVHILIIVIILSKPYLNVKGKFIPKLKCCH